MTYAPPPSFTGVPATDPTNVLGRRFLAFLVDVWIPIIAAVVVGLVLWFGSATQFHKEFSGENVCSAIQAERNLTCVESTNDYWLSTNSDTARAFGVAGLIWLLGPLNHFVLQGITGASVGKHMTGLRVVDAQGNQAGFGKNALRSLLLIVDAFCSWLVGGIVVLATHPHRRIGDMAAGTYVVGKGSVGTPVLAPPMVPPSAWTPPPVAMAPSTPAEPASPMSWGAAPPVAPTGTDAPATASTDAPPSVDQAGWAAPEASAPSAPATPAAPPATASDPTQPQWDPARNAYIAWEPQTQRWMQHDAATNQWRPI